MLTDLPAEVWAGTPREGPPCPAASQYPVLSFSWGPNESYSPSGGGGAVLTYFMDREAEKNVLMQGAAFEDSRRVCWLS